jgi:hypothetical protein
MRYLKRSRTKPTCRGFFDMHLVHRKTRRVCGSAVLTKVIDLGDLNFQGSFVKPGKARPAPRKNSPTPVRCDLNRGEHACGLLQLEHTAFLEREHDILERGVGLIFHQPNIDIIRKT